MKQIKSKKRVRGFGEVYTQPREVNAMLDLAKEESYLINSLFLEPTCGNGNFLVEILKRKLSVSKTKEDTLNALRSIYAIDILEDNINESKKRLYELVKDDLTRDEAFFIMNQNIVCGDSLELLSRSPYTETKFDVIIGNPPYQAPTGRGGYGKAVASIYPKFVMRSQALKPKKLIMIIPSRWFSGGVGIVNEFKNLMINDRRVKELHDFRHSKECFSGVDIESGVCYFLWELNYDGPCHIFSHKGGKITEDSIRFLDEGNAGFFIRSAYGVSIVNKVFKTPTPTFDQLFTSSEPFKLESNFSNFQLEPFENALLMHKRGGVGYVSRDKIKRNEDLIDAHKILISVAYGIGKNAPYQVINRPFYSGSGECCTETYLAIGPFANEAEANHAISYMKTKLFRFLVFLKKTYQSTYKNTFSLIPLQDFSKPWTDEELYEKYGLTQEEIDYIESMIRPMK